MASGIKEAEHIQNQYIAFMQKYTEAITLCPEVAGWSAF
jgi:hypothetical protein